MSTVLYQNVFTDGLLSSFIIPFHSQTAFFAMRAFGDQDTATMQTAAVFAVVGGVIGHLLNWSIGAGLLYFSRLKKIGFWDDSYEKIRPYYAKYGLYTMLLSWATLFGVFSLAAGVFGVSLKRTVPLLLIGQALYYSYYLYH